MPTDASEHRPLAERIREKEERGEKYIAFEYFPPRTDDGVQNLYERFHRMKAQSKSFSKDLELPAIQHFLCLKESVLPVSEQGFLWPLKGHLTTDFALGNQIEKGEMFKERCGKEIRENMVV